MFVSYELNMSGREITKSVLISTHAKCVHFVIDSDNTNKQFLLVEALNGNCTSRLNDARFMRLSKIKKF